MFVGPLSVQIALRITKNFFVTGDSKRVVAGCVREVGGCTGKVTMYGETVVAKQMWSL